jgi:hypothetical protein
MALDAMEAAFSKDTPQMPKGFTPLLFFLRSVCGEETEW